MEVENISEKIDLTAFLGRCLKILAKLWVPILALAVLLGGINYFRAKRSFVPYYESQAIFSVIAGQYGDDSAGNAYYYDYNATSSLVTAFPSMLGTDMMRDLILDRLDKGYINGTIVASQLVDTNLFELTVRSTVPEDAYEILCAVIECYPQVMVYTMDTPRMVIRQEPNLPDTPVNHFDGKQALMKGALVGLAIGAAVVALFAMVTRTVVGARDLKKLVNLPVLATLPFVAEKKRRSNRQMTISAQDDPGMSEALRGLRTKLSKHLADGEGKVILITSTVPGEGKSTISINLALSLAAEGRRVALLDADFRNQSIHRMLGAKPRKSLMECMKNKAGVVENLRRIGDQEVYYLSGESVSKRYYNIDAQSLKRILAELDPLFDYVILDSPPCTVVSDTVLLAKHADAVVYVVKQDYANESQILEGVSSLHEHGASLAGTILNAVPRSVSSAYGYGHYGYGYGYGSKYGYGKKYGYGSQKKS